MSVNQLDQLNLAAIPHPAGGYFPSPSAWEDQVFYFLMLDRFADDKEQAYRDIQGNLVTSGTTPLFKPGDRNNAVQNDAAAAKGGKQVDAISVGISKA